MQNPSRVENNAACVRACVRACVYAHMIYDIRTYF